MDNNEAKIKRDKFSAVGNLLSKIDSAKELIKSAILANEKPIIAFSGGKDSIVVMDIVRFVDPNIACVFENTTNEYPETLDFVKTISNVITIHPKKTFMECIDEYGMPQQKIKSKSHGSYCCIWLKEKPAAEFYKTNAIDLVFTGLTMSESRNRMMMLKRMGVYYFYKKDKYYKCHPIWDWTEAEVWQYIDIKKLNYNKIYDIVDRTLDGRWTRCGCRFCTAYKSWESVSNKYNPKDAQWMLKKLKEENVNLIRG